MRINEIALGRSVKYNFFDVFASVTPRDGRPGVSIKVRKDRPAETRKSGIYVWYHPDWGYFYVGIASKDNFTERWNKHTQKLLDMCTSAKQMHNWREFAIKWKSAGYGLNDLKDVTIRFFPVTSASEYHGDNLKADLRELETRIISWLNPACNVEFKTDKPSATKFPTSQPNDLATVK